MDQVPPTISIVLHRGDYYEPGLCNIIEYNQD